MVSGSSRWYKFRDSIKRQKLIKDKKNCLSRTKSMVINRLLSIIDVWHFHIDRNLLEKFHVINNYLTIHRLIDWISFNNNTLRINFFYCRWRTSLRGSSNWFMTSAYMFSSNKINKNTKSDAHLKWKRWEMKEGDLSSHLSGYRNYARTKKQRIK